MSLVFLSELIGTAILILLGNGVVANVNLNKSGMKGAGPVQITFGWGLAVMLPAFVFGAASGAHFNPALTLALAADGSLAWGLVPVYLAGQMLGAFLGAALVLALFYDQFKATDDPAVKRGCFCTAPAVPNLPRNFLSEMVGTFVLVFAIKGIAQVTGCAGGLGNVFVFGIIVSIGMSLGGLTGYAINPARDLGPRLAHALLPVPGKGPSNWGYALVPILGPVAGALAAVLLYANMPWTPSADAADAERPKHVVFLAFDGMGSAYSDESLKVPNMRRMMEEGAWTMHNRSILPSSSAANWASIFMAAASEQHGYVAWNTTNSVVKPLWTMPSGRFPDVYALCRRAHPSADLGYVYDWKGLEYVIDLSACSYTLQTNACLDAGLGYFLKKKPLLMSFLYDHPDHEGHGSGFGSPEYRKAIEEADVAVGKLMDAIRAEGMLDDTVLIVGSDHGGVKKNHGGATVAEMDKPLIFWGKGVKKGHPIENATFSYDIGATMAWLLGLDLPQICIGRPILEAFE